MASLFAIKTTFTAKSLLKTPFTRVKVAFIPASALAFVPPKKVVYSAVQDKAKRIVLKTCAFDAVFAVFPVLLLSEIKSVVLQISLLESFVLSEVNKTYCVLSSGFSSIYSVALSARRIIVCTPIGETLKCIFADLSSKPLPS
ncbi:hypothetical protein D3C84_661780 [compost metagenome]